MPFPHVFEPVALRHKTLTNRIMFGAHTANMAEVGLPGDRHLGYYGERALGGAAMIVVEPVPVHRTAVLTRGNFRHDDDAVIPALPPRDRRRARRTDIVMIQQLYHVGQHGDLDNSFAPNWSPSGLPSYHDSDGSHAMTEAEIEEIIEGFVASALAAPRTRASTGSSSSPPTTRWSTSSGRRGRTAGPTRGAARSRAACASRRRSSTGIRAACGDDFIIGLAISMDEGSDPALSHGGAGRDRRLARPATR